MKRRSKLLMCLQFCAFLSFAAFLSIPATGFALSLEKAKQQGMVGEKLDGYLGAVENSAKVQALISDINSRRKSKYKQIAKSSGTDLKTVELLAGKKAVEKTAPGEFIQLPNGQWQKK